MAQNGAENVNSSCDLIKGWEYHPAAAVLLKPPPYTS